MIATEVLYRAVSSRDARFDGRVFIGVTSTGIYCRPICPARTPKLENIRFFEHAAAAEHAGFRACRRCRPDVSPDSPEWDIRADLVGRALRLIADGIADTEGITGLSRRLAVGERHLRRRFIEEVGAPPHVIARSRRARLARQLIDQTDLPLSQIAFEAGFASIRAFNDTIRAIYGRPPSAFRNGKVRPAALTLGLRARAPFDAHGALAFLAARAIPGVEEAADGAYRRTTRIGDGIAIVELGPEGEGMRLTVHGETTGGLARVVQGARRLLDLDADPAAVNDVLAGDPVLRRSIQRRPGLRLPGPFDPFEVAVRAVVGQQVSVTAASTIAGRLAARAGTPLPEPAGSLTHLFPTPAQLAEADLSALGVPGARARAVHALARAVAEGEVVLDGSAPPEDVRAALLSLPGIGPWTVEVIAMRALRDPDAFPAGDLGVRRAAERLGIARITAHAERWRPWRAYAAMHLWATLNDGGRR